MLKEDPISRLQASKQSVYSFYYKNLIKIPTHKGANSYKIMQQTYRKDLNRDPNF